MAGRLLAFMFVVFVCTGIAGAFGAQDPEGTLRFEVEEWTMPRDAWLVNKHTDTKWNLWSTDKDAHKKWSGGVVLQSPRVMADRRSDDEGAPVLHTVLTGIPKGTYDIALSARTRPIGVSFDGRTWTKSGGGIIARDVRIKYGRFELWVDDRFTADNPEGRGSCYYDCIVLYPSGPEYIAKILGPRPRVRGWAKVRCEEQLDRGVVAMRTPDGVYVGWRLLKDDPADIAFDVFRQVRSGRRAKVNTEPIRTTTDFLDSNAPPDTTPVYSVRPAEGVRGLSAKRRASGPQDSTTTVVGKGAAPYVSIKLDGDHRFSRIGIADLDGDTRLDYVIKQPAGSIDPYGSYWKPSPETYKLEAYLHDGTHLWTRDLGWAIERGIWYSPYIVCDLDGDGRAEVAVKTGEGDSRGNDGKVATGPEYLSVWDGMTGKDVARVPWPSRAGFMKLTNSYNYASRNQIAVAFLDGKTPCLIALRGTYNLMKAEAYRLNHDRLELLWKYGNENLPRQYWGQGAHFTRAVDVDGDGRDEVMLGSAILDDNGIPLWTLGMGHNDFAYVGDIDPHRPGLEIYYGFETRAPRNGMCLADAISGRIIWGFGEPTTHIHGAGMCADIDPTVPGLECFGLDCLSKRPSISKGPWLWAADGTLLWFDKPFLGKTYSIATVYWDADLQKEVLRGGKVSDYTGSAVGSVGGRRVLIADVIGDWREEIISSAPGEIRIYSTTIPATDRRVCLLQDHIYRSDVTMSSMGYTKVPMTSFCLEAHWPGLNLTAVTEDGKDACRAVVSAPVGRAVTGRLVLQGDGLRVEPHAFNVNVARGDRQVMTATLIAEAGSGGKRSVQGTFSGTVHASRARPRPGRLPTDPLGPLPPRSKYKVTLRGCVPVKVADKVLSGLPLFEAEDIASEGGGKVKIRTDKQGTSKDSISHWDDKGHWLEWRIRAPESRAYEVVVRYCTPQEALRKVSVDGHVLGVCAFTATGGFGSVASDWEHAVLRQNGKPLRLRLYAGGHTIRFENVDGQGMNLDYLAVRRVN